MRNAYLAQKCTIIATIVKKIKLIKLIVLLAKKIFIYIIYKEKINV